MRNHLLAAGLAAAALVPSAAFAQQTCEQRAASRTVGTIAGGGIGALLGSAIAGRDDRTTGAVIGGIGGAIVGNQLAGSRSDCSRAYGYYDDNGQWHASATPAAQAQGYYDRSGAWVQGRPNGYYDSQGRWVSAQADVAASGYYVKGRFVPASASGYYDTDGRWIAGAASGRYDRNGRWIPGPAVGRYDASGRWIAGRPAGRHDANGVWIPDAQPGYYENGRWRAGQTYGYYDARGRWHATAQGGAQPDYRSDRADWSGAPAGYAARHDWLETRVERGVRSGALRRDEGERALRDLRDIRREARGLRRDEGGRLNRRDDLRMQARLDEVNAGLRWSSGASARRN